jgi:hypothetical protein
MESVHRLALRMKVRKLTGTVVHHCAVLVKLLERERVTATLVKGWAVADGEVCEHYWVRADSDMDIGYELACLFTPELTSITPSLLLELPEGLKRVDHSDPENARLFDLFHTDRVAFWKEAPPDVRAFTKACSSS